MIRKLAKFIFFGNYFLGFCIAALSYETLIQCGFQQLSYIYFILVFLLTVVYYTYAYTTEIHFYQGQNTRQRWYINNKLFIKKTQSVLVALIVFAGCNFFYTFYHRIAVLSFAQWLLLLIFPALAALYYGIVIKPNFSFNIRRYGWLKPFIIGFVATGTVTVYPLILFSKNAHPAVFSSVEEMLFFAANFMFTSVIAIMFDIKDFSADHNHQLKTFIVHFGLRKTIYYLLLPLVFAGLTAMVFFCFLKNYTTVQIILNALPFMLLAIVAWSLQHRKKILYYLAVIDGLLLVKAICGISAVLYF